jgi:hypothetical protein
MSHRRLATALVAPVVIALLGCAKPGVVGTWKGTVSAGPAGQIPTTFVLKDGGTFTQTTKVPTGEVVGTGKYTIDGEKLTFTVTDATMGGKSVFNELPAAMRNQSTTFKREGDTLTLTTESGQTMSLTAVK